ncbi:DUF6233 domain-containing protein [Streptomyces sp. ECR2.10]
MSSLSRPPAYARTSAVISRRSSWAAARSGRCRPATRQQALDGLRRQVPAWVHCRPDAALGLLD